MTDINEEITRLFFEYNGFLVKTNVRYSLNNVDSDIDLMVFNLHPKGSESQDVKFVIKDIEELKK
ncbi:MAG: hypothetical protein R2741_11090 [Methanolobus sp.]